MKTILLALLVLFSTWVQAQYYYKDIIGTRETTGIIKAYKNNKVTRVLVNTFDAEGVKSNDFYVEQQFSLPDSRLRTITRTDDENASTLLSMADNEGRVIKTIDSSGNLVTTTTYQYNPAGNLTLISSATVDTAKGINETEDHRWEYANNNVSKMMRIKNKNDTAFVTFKLDDAGNVSEEVSIRKGIKSDPVYYYYDVQKRLTDIVRFNNRSRRLLPEYMFEYSPANQVIQKITVPANSSDYMIWRYQYDATGLKVKEAVYDKYKQLTGKIEYLYQRG
jgi:YD repeat-containing protein